MTKRLTNMKRHLSWFSALSILALLVILANTYINNKKDNWEKDVRTNVMEILIGKKSNLEKALFSRIYYTKGISAYVSYNPNITNDEYYELAEEFIGNDSVISSMALSKDCIINAIYPLEGHENALGLNLLDHKDRREIVEKTIETHKTFVAGPVDLVEGGVAFVSYTPIFDKTNDTKGAFWGMTDIVIKLNSYLKSAGISEVESKLRFSLKGIDGKGAQGEVFFGDEQIFQDNPVVVSIELPYGHWVLAAVPAEGWQTYLSQDQVLQRVLYFSSFLISILIWFLLRTEYHIRNNAKDQHAILNSLDNVIIEFDNEGIYRKIVSTNLDLLVDKGENLVGNSVFDVFDKELAQLFYDKIKQCLKDQELVLFDYPLAIHGVPKWFQGRMSYKSTSSVILSAYDITRNKTYEQELKQSSEMKDKLFSIISHDLKNPVGTSEALIGQLLEQYDNIAEAEKKKILSSLHKSSERTLNLLDNLLNWSKAQRGSLLVDKHALDMREMCEKVSDLFVDSLKNKSLTLNINVKVNQMVMGDEVMSSTIIRNILSNAIKFTQDGGIIQIDAKINKENKHLLLCVEDNGLGMDTERVASVFYFGKTKNMPGTNNESGSGLGLALCKELAEIQNGRIWAESELNKGSSFYFSLPLA